MICLLILNKFEDFKKKSSNIAFDSKFIFEICKENENYVYPKIIDSFLTKNECKEIINLAKKNTFYDSKVKLNTIQKNHRTSKTSWLKFDKNNKILNKIYEKYSKLVNIPKNFIGSMQIIYYDKNGFFNEHQDQCYSDSDYCKDLTNSRGARFCNLFIYLNDDFKGGETTFPKLNLKIKPKTGKVILFYMLNSAGTKVHPFAIHSGEKIKSGIKMAANLWIRKKIN